MRVFRPGSNPSHKEPNPMTQADSVHSTPPTNTPTTRRRFLSNAAGVAAGGTVLALATIPPAPAIAAPASPLDPANVSPVGADPIFAMIILHKKLTADWQERYDQLQDAEHAAEQEHGRRPIELIHWRHYHIGASEIDARRESLLEAGEINRATVEREYLDANARYQAKVAAGIAWDKSTGLETLRKDVDRRGTAEHRYAKRLARTMPTTAAGVAALIQHALEDDLVADESYWHMTALRTAVAALNCIGAAVQS
jgi:hypothetical protein